MVSSRRITRTIIRRSESEGAKFLKSLKPLAQLPDSKKQSAAIEPRFCFRRPSKEFTCGVVGSIRLSFCWVLVQIAHRRKLLPGELCPIQP
jgi:hypothetical protein